MELANAIKTAPLAFGLGLIVQNALQITTSAVTANLAVLDFMVIIVMLNVRPLRIALEMENAHQQDNVCAIKALILAFGLGLIVQNALQITTSAVTANLAVLDFMVIIVMLNVRPLRIALEMENVHQQDNVCAIKALILAFGLGLIVQNALQITPSIIVAKLVVLDFMALTVQLNVYH